MERMLKNGQSLRSVARELKRSPSTIIDEFNKNANNHHYLAAKAEKKAQQNKTCRPYTRMHKIKVSRISTFGHYLRETVGLGWTPQQIAADAAHLFDIKISAATISNYIKRYEPEWEDDGLFAVMAPIPIDGKWLAQQTLRRRWNTKLTLIFGWKPKRTVAQIKAAVASGTDSFSSDLRRVLRHLEPYPIVKIQCAEVTIFRISLPDVPTWILRQMSLDLIYLTYIPAAAKMFENHLNESLEQAANNLEMRSACLASLDMTTFDWSFTNLANCDFKNSQYTHSDSIDIIRTFNTSSCRWDGLNNIISSVAVAKQLNMWISCLAWRAYLKKQVDCYDPQSCEIKLTSDNFPARRQLDDEEIIIKFLGAFYPGGIHTYSEVFYWHDNFINPTAKQSLHFWGYFF